MASFLICKESKIESNTSFYGCFYMGPFEPNQSVTIANSLRRTLLSELYGLAITSVEIEGASHEYSNLKGVRESILDLLLNLKQLVLKKTMYSVKPILGYLRVQGPGKVFASDLRLPPFVQCVDPNHLIATLDEDGILSMKVMIHYGHKWLSPPNQFFMPPKSPDLRDTMHSVPDQNALNLQSPIEENEEVEDDEELLYYKGYIETPEEARGAKEKTKEEKVSEKEREERAAKKIKKENQIRLLETLDTLPRDSFKNVLNFHFLKRRFIFHQMKKVGFILSRTYMEILSRQGLHLLNRSLHLQERTRTRLSEWNVKKQYPGIDLKKIRLRPFIVRKDQNIKLGENVPDPLSDSIASDWLSLIPKNRLKKERLKTENTSTSRRKSMIVKRSSRPITLDAVFNPVNKVNFTIERSDYKTTLERLRHAEEVSGFYELIRASNLRAFKFLSRFSSKHAKKKVKSRFHFSSHNPQEKTKAEQKTASHAPLQKQNRNVSHLRTLGHVQNPKNSQSAKKGQMNPSLQSAPTMESADHKTPFVALLSRTREDALNMFLDYQAELDVLKSTTPKNNIILEIWTNGSLHPRDALYQTFMNLMDVFSRLHEITPFLNLAANLVRFPSKAEGDKPVEKRWEPVLKQMKMGKIETSLVSSLVPISADNYLATYMTPNARKFRTILKPRLKPKFLKRIKSKSNGLKKINSKEQAIQSKTKRIVKTSPMLATLTRKIAKKPTLKKVSKVSKVGEPKAMKAAKMTVRKWITQIKPELNKKKIEKILSKISSRLKPKTKKTENPKLTTLLKKETKTEFKRPPNVIKSKTKVEITDRSKARKSRIANTPLKPIKQKEVKAEIKKESKPRAKSVITPKAKPVPTAKPKLITEPKSKSITEPETISKTTPKSTLKSTSKTKLETKSKTETPSKTPSKLKPELKPVTKQPRKPKLK